MTYVFLRWIISTYNKGSYKRNLNKRLIWQQNYIMDFHLSTKIFFFHFKCFQLSYIWRHCGLFFNCEVILSKATRSFKQSFNWMWSSNLLKQFAKILFSQQIKLRLPLVVVRCVWNTFYHIGNFFWPAIALLFVVMM